MYLRQILTAIWSSGRARGEQEEESEKGAKAHGTVLYRKRYLRARTLPRSPREARPVSRVKSSGRRRGRQDVTSDSNNANIAYYDEFADEYALFFHDLERNMEQEGDWLDAILRTHHVRTVLDASCGTGRQAIPLCERGYNVVAADPSSRMLKGARAEAQQHHVRLTFLQLGFADLSAHFDSEFDAVVALGNGLCNQDSPESIEQSLLSLRRCCRRGGLCLVGIKDFDTIRRSAGRFHEHGVVDRDGRRTILFELWDVQDPLLLCTAFVVQGKCPQEGTVGDWTTRARTTREYMLCNDELAAMARRIGFSGVTRLDHPSEAVFMLQT